jgi:hypothetical protein
MRAAHPWAIARWGPTRRWLSLPGCPVKSQGVLCIGRAQEKSVTVQWPNQSFI